MKNDNMNTQNLVLLDDSELRDISGGAEVLSSGTHLCFLPNSSLSPEALEERAKNRNPSLLEIYTPTDTSDPASSADQAVELQPLANVGIAILKKQP